MKYTTLDYILDMVIFLAGRNKYGNVVTLRTQFPLPEEKLRYIEKGVLKKINRHITAFWKKEGKIDYVDCDLDFDAKFPYDAYPLQDLIEGEINDKKIK